ncbi:helix-turn-helix domain-containing protein [Pseudomonas sp. MH9.2]|uniref:TetR/AcrR family transcriptional regulator n=1 Tax=unclassified Pseudomonas TaxID=196821 RepID=UPI002AC9B597|nr:MULTISPECIES: helix-turn-helix domain-containing protein [unclassified Pseudomonas]MEB0028925.1 helix-turn-helix domain-containing protein [Pseudomonas sp. MH9.2]MEE3508380.1 helix-turn-helix domain-containing protein [Pseudomonas sp. 10C3]WPX68609.1 helix-turn-helix domain-containing protein [Pseudomonas sp. MH9.2]
MTTPPHSALGAHIIATTAKIISEEGIGAATVRAVAKSAGVQAPQIYHHVGNMDELLDSVATHLWAAFRTAQGKTANPVHGLYDAIEALIAFGIRHPELYLRTSMPRNGEVSGLWKLQIDYLRERVQQVAKSGRLRVGEKQAIEFIHPFCVGMIFTCLHKTSRSTDTSWLALKAVSPLLQPELPEISELGQARKAPAFASGLKASLGEVHVLSLGESALLRELLERIASA